MDQQVDIEEVLKSLRETIGEQALQIAILKSLNAKLTSPGDLTSSS